jgi:hypothetical protein
MQSNWLGSRKVRKGRKDIETLKPAIPSLKNKRGDFFHHHYGKVTESADDQLASRAYLELGMKIF